MGGGAGSLVSLFLSLSHFRSLSHSSLPLSPSILPPHDAPPLLRSGGAEEPWCRIILYLPSPPRSKTLVATTRPVESPPSTLSTQVTTPRAPVPLLLLLLLLLPLFKLEEEEEEETASESPLLLGAGGA